MDPEQNIPLKQCDKVLLYFRLSLMFSRQLNKWFYFTERLWAVLKRASTLSRHVVKYAVIILNFPKKGRIWWVYLKLTAMAVKRRAFRLFLSYKANVEQIQCIFLKCLWLTVNKDICRTWSSSYRERNENVFLKIGRNALKYR